MLFKPLPPHEELLRLLDYDPETGLITLKSTGKPALCTSRRGYHIGSLCGVNNCRAHRVAWKFVHGVDPSGEIDHINGDRADNRISNLRLVSHVANGRNQKRHCTNKTGVSGVRWYSSRSKWTARISDGHRELFLGYFVNLEDAIAARKNAERKLGYHPNHGRAA